MKTIVLGNGQLGSYVYKHWDNFLDFSLDVIDYPEFNIGNPTDCEKIVEKYDVIINCAAYTNVDKAESEPLKCMCINTAGPISLYGNCLKASNLMNFANGKKLIHISTGFVYGSNDPNYAPLKEEDPLNPSNQYAITKKLADEYLEKFSAFTKNCLILRPAWLFGPNSDHNFIEKIRKALTENDKIKGVTDEIGSLTSVDLILKAIKSYLVGTLPPGVYNIANEGYASRYDIANFVKEEIGSKCEITPCSLDDFNRAAKIGKNSFLDCTKLKSYTNFDIPDWKVDVKKVLNGEMF